MCWCAPKHFKMKIFIVLLSSVISLSGFSQTVQDFTLTNVQDGKSVSLYSFQNCKGIAVIFTSNECPYDIKYTERIKMLNEQYKGSIQFVMINAHTEPRENEKAMAQKYESWKIPVPYLADKDQVAMGCFDAKKSPEVFLLKKEADIFNVVYNGAIDDNPLVNTDVNNPYLKNAIDQLLKGDKVSVRSNRAPGCTIRKRR